MGNVQVWDDDERLLELCEESPVESNKARIT